MLDIKEESTKKLVEVVEDIKTCMFTTTDKYCNVFSRPMLTIKMDNEYCLWYFINRHSDKMKDISTGKQVTLVYSHPGKSTYMNILGKCETVADENKTKELWQPALKSYFPQGIEDPSLCLLKVVIDEAHYWDNAENDMICLYKNESHNPYQTISESSSFIPQTSHW